MTSKAIQTPFARLSYPILFTPKANDQGKMLYSCALLFPKDFATAGARLGLPPRLIEAAGPALSAMKKLAAETAIEFFGGKDKLPLGIKNQDLGKASGWPFRDQAQRPGEGYEPGALMINISSTIKPGLVDRNLVDILNEQDLYPGCWVRASVTCYGYKAKGNTGVSFGLANIQKLCDDDPIAGRSRPEADFEAVDGAVGSKGGAAASDDVDSLFD